jgi:HlyD family secretion protein
MPKHLFRWTLILLVAAGLALLIWRGTRPKAVAVTLKPVTRGTVLHTVANTRAGTVKACRRAKLSPSIGGQIAELPIREGDSVKAGQLLLALWNSDLQAQVLLAERQIKSAVSRSQATCLKSEVARRSADRLLTLRRSDAVSVELADNATAEADASQAECQAARSEIAVREAQLAVARANLERTRLTAPFNGVVAEITAELFEYVTPSPVGVPTPPAVDIIDTTCFYVAAPIDEVDAAGIRVGMPADISMDAYGNRHFSGTVRRISDYVLDVEKQARTVDVEVVFDETPANGKLLAGYSADIEVILETRPDVVRVPTESVLASKNVYVYDSREKRIHLRDIQTGIANWDYTEVITGLEVGEQVVINVDNPDLASDAPASPQEAAP